MTTKSVKQTVHSLTFRYVDIASNLTKTSKLSVDIGIYELLKINEVLLELGKGSEVCARKRAPTLTDKWLYDTSGQQKTLHPNVSFAGYMREYLYCVLIDSEYLDGYKIIPEYHKVMCRKDDLSNTTIRVPTSLFFALSSLFGADNCETIIKKAYLALRTNTPNEANFSFLLRHKLLEQVMKPNLARVDFIDLVT